MRHALVTGATSGMGLEIAKALARSGVKTTLVARDAESGSCAVEKIKALDPASAVSMLDADVSLMGSVRALADRFRATSPRLDILVHSAGVIDMSRPLTAEGIEKNFALNYLSRYLLTSLLGDLLVDGSRVLALATAGIQPVRFDLAAVTRAEGLSGFRAYQQSQAANDVWGADLADRLRPRGVHVAVVNPGLVRTSIRRSRGAPLWLRLFDLAATPFAVSPSRGAQTAIHLALQADWPAGVFFGADLKPLQVSEKTSAAAVTTELAAASRTLVQRATKD